MQVRILCGGQYAYACIKYPAGAMDVQLQPGRSARQSLQESAQEIQNAQAAIAKATQ